MSKTVTISESEYFMLKGQARSWEDVFEAIDKVDTNWFLQIGSGADLAVKFINEMSNKAQLLDSLYSNQEED